jgi:hypothetical protein
VRTLAARARFSLALAARDLAVRTLAPPHPLAVSALAALAVPYSWAVSALAALAALLASGPAQRLLYVASSTSSKDIYWLVGVRDVQSGVD